MVFKRKRTFSESFIIESHLKSCDVLAAKASKVNEQSKDTDPEQRSVPGLQALD